MIFKSFEFKKIDIKKYNFYLFYGENNGLKKELIEVNFRKVFKDKTYNYEENSILLNQKKFFDEILTKSFFENEKLIIISSTSNKIFDVVEEIIEKRIADVTVILLADKLDKKSKLRSLFEKDKSLICIPFYSDNYQSLFYIAESFFKKIKISVSQEILNTLINRASGDRQNLKNEINKIENFLINKKKISLQEVLKLTNLSENNNFSELVDNCLAKNEKKLLNIINENNFSNDDTIIIIRTFLYKAKRLLRINNELKSKKNIENVLTSFKPPIFWKDKDLVKQQIKNYSEENAETLIQSISDTELKIKKNYNNSINILLDFVLNLGKQINNKI
jgi:DNA polymerase III subunit delta